MKKESSKKCKSIKNIIIVAGEASGDMHGAALVKEMVKITPSLKFHGIGGSELKRAGVNILADASEMAVVGFSEVISKFLIILKTMNKMKKALDFYMPALLILIDYPGFNLALAKIAKKKGIKVFYYISPQVWAWREGRINKIKKYVDKMAVVFPFEVDIYASRGFNVNYVGHPLVDKITTTISKEKSKKILGLSANKATIGLLPGSRLAEITSLLPEMLRAAQILKKNIKNIQFILPKANTLEEKILLKIISGFDIKIKVVTGHTYEAISCCDFAIVASGTATLETGLLGVPMIIVYKVSPFSYLIGRMMIDVKNIGLVNIVAGKTIVPEFIQKDVNGECIATETLDILISERYEQIKKELSAIRSKLGDPGAAERAAKIACAMV